MPISDLIARPDSMGNTISQNLEMFDEHNNNIEAKEILHV